MALPPDARAEEVKRRGARDPVTPDLRSAILARDGGCVVSLLRIPNVGPCGGRLTIAHVRDAAGGRMGKRPPSTRRRLAAVCAVHALPPENIVDRREVRAEVDRYLEGLEGAEPDGSRPWEAVRRVRARGVDLGLSENGGTR